MAQIKWRGKDQQEAERVVRNFNRKVDYWTKRGLKDLPDKVSLKELKAGITSRQDFNREIKSLKRFSQKGAEQPVTLDTGVVITKWEKKEIGYLTAAVNRKRQKKHDELADLEMKSRGKDLGYSLKEMGSAQLNSLKRKEVRLNRIRSKREMQKLKESLKFQAQSKFFDIKDRQYHENYLTALEHVFGDRARGLIDHIRKLPTDFVVNLLYTETEAEIGFIYQELDVIAKFEVLLDVWGYGKNADERDQMVIDFTKETAIGYRLGENDTDIIRSRERSPRSQDMDLDSLLLELGRDEPDD